MRTKVRLDYALPLDLRGEPCRVLIFGDAPAVGANEHEDAFIGDSPWAATIVLVPTSGRTGLIRSVAVTDRRVGLMSGRGGPIKDVHPDWISDLDPLITDVRALFSGGEALLCTPGSAYWVDGPPDLESPE